MKHHSMRWAYLLGGFIIIASVMSFGLVSTLVFHMDEQQALSMLAMIPLMLVFTFGGLYFVVRGIQKRNSVLIDAIHEVSQGNMEVQIPLKNAQEYSQVYQEFNSMVRELKKSKDNMQDFINMFAHEFKTPITSVSGFAHLLKSDNGVIDEEERKEYLEVIADQSDRLVKLCENSLLLSKIEAMEIVTEQEDYDLAELIRRCVITFLPQMDAKNITFTMPEDLSLPYYGNREMMMHVWQNLISNAVKYTPEGGTVSITCEEKEGNYILSISDSGIGMNKETMEHIFDRYYQNSPGNLTAGSGIGLPIVKRITELSGGTVSAESVRGQGSTFRLILPVNQKKIQN